jgi:hypothetical protein
LCIFQKYIIQIEDNNFAPSSSFASSPSSSSTSPPFYWNRAAAWRGLNFFLQTFFPPVSPSLDALLRATTLSSLLLPTTNTHDESTQWTLALLRHTLSSQQFWHTLDAGVHVHQVLAQNLLKLTKNIVSPQKSLAFSVWPVFLRSVAFVQRPEDEFELLYVDTFFSMIHSENWTQLGETRFAAWCAVFDVVEFCYAEKRPRTAFLWAELWQDQAVGMATSASVDIEQKV